MKTYLLLILFAFALTNKIVQKEFVDYLKKNVKWKVADPENNKFRDWTDEEIKQMFNSKNLKKPRPIKNINKRKVPNPPPIEEYDWRMDYPYCVTDIKNYMNCAASWAFASTTVLEQRFCMDTSEPILLSPQDLISCSTENEGCDGGFLQFAWDYLVDNGIVDIDCFPYTSGEGDVEPCITKCKNGAEWKKYKSLMVEDFHGPDMIMNDLTMNGPLSTTMDVYDDFLDYVAGIYSYFGGDYVGSLDTVIVGFSFDFDEYYWICQNSWGEDWGEEGYFRIYLGECGIDDFAFSGWPLIEDKNH